MLLIVTMQRADRREGREPDLRLLFCKTIPVFLIIGMVPLYGQAAGEATAQASSAAAQPITITFDEAIRRAEANEPLFAQALADSRSAGLDPAIARGGLLPDVAFHNQALYTQANGQQNQAGQGVGSQPSPKFIANNAVREYASQGVVNETLGLAGIAGVRRADAEAARAVAELEIARRGLMTAVTSLYYGSIAAGNKLAVAERAHGEAADFTGLTGKREQAREAAHADTVKAQLVEQKRQRELTDARVADEKARLELAVLLFPDPRTSYVLVPARSSSELPSRGEVDQAAAKNNLELKSALAALRVSDADVLTARAAYLPDLGLNVTYGVDAPQFAVNGPDKVRNLGYSASVTLDIPLWDWLSTEHKVKQSEIRRDAARVVLTATQSRLIARLDEAYSEAAAAHDLLASLDASVETATESLRLTKLRYAGGEATVLEVVDAQDAYVGAQDDRENGTVRYEAARADLESLTGKL
jgi:outer membrane protein TolC